MNSPITTTFVLVAALACARTSFGQTLPDCSSLPAPIYGLGGSATLPILGRVADALNKSTPPQSLVYQAPGACFGINALIAGTKLTGTAFYWGADGKQATCQLPVTGVEAQFANMGNSAALCPGVTLPADIIDIQGPVVPFNIIVPNGSSQQSISADAAYFVFGFGQQAGVVPWTDDAFIARRDANSAAQLFIALAAGVPPEKFKGVDTKTNSGTVAKLVEAATVNKAEAAIGLVSGEIADANRDKVRTLAYQHRGQSCGYWPDSSPTAFDKRNVRTGQYHIWSAMHFFTRLTAPGGAPRFPAARDLIGFFGGDRTPPPNVDIRALTIKAGSVPQCAMEVARDTDLGPMRSYTPAEPCGCYFDSLTSTGGTACQACASDATCPTGAPHCRFGYCEVN